jgi:ubiquinone/menaquinone biosynthesis C-methylase UbiE
MSFFDLPVSDYVGLKFGMQEEDKWNFVSNTTEIHLNFIKNWAPKFNDWAKRLTWPKGRLHIDIGSGIGTMSYLVGRQNYHSIAIELNATNLAGGATLARAVPATQTASMHLWVANIFDLPLPDHSVDFITIKEVLHHLPDTTSLFAELVRVLKPGGLVYVWEPFWPSRATGPLRWLLVEKIIRPQELAQGIHHVYYSWSDYQRMFQNAATTFDMRPLWKRGKLRHHLSQNKIGFGRVEAKLTLRPARPRPIPQRRQIDPADFILPQYLDRSLQAAEQYKAYLESLKPD